MVQFLKTTPALKVLLQRSGSERRRWYRTVRIVGKTVWHDLFLSSSGRRWESVNDAAAETVAATQIAAGSTSETVRKTVPLFRIARDLSSPCNRTNLWQVETCETRSFGSRSVGDRV